MSNTPRIVQLVLAALAGALLAGGGYALASGGSRTIHGCVVRGSHQLLVQRRCARGQTGLSWSQRGPAGPRGRTGPAGPSALGAWGQVFIGAGTTSVSGQNLTASYVGVGEAAVRLTGGPCVGQTPDVVATPVTAAGAAPAVAYVAGASTGSFGLNVGSFVGGTFMPQNLAVSVAVFCQPA